MINGSSLWALSERKAAEMSLRRLGLLLPLPVVFSQGWSPGHLPGLHHLVAFERKNIETTEPAALRNNVLRRSLGQSHVRLRLSTAATLTQILVSQSQKASDAKCLSTDVPCIHFPSQPSTRVPSATAAASITACSSLRLISGAAASQITCSPRTASIAYVSARTLV